MKARAEKPAHAGITHLQKSRTNFCLLDIMHKTTANEGIHTDLAADMNDKSCFNDFCSIIKHIMHTNQNILYQNTTSHTLRAMTTQPQCKKTACAPISSHEINFGEKTHESIINIHFVKTNAHYISINVLRMLI